MCCYSCRLASRRALSMLYQDMDTQPAPASPPILTLIRSLSPAPLRQDFLLSCFHLRILSDSIWAALDANRMNNNLTYVVWYNEGNTKENMRVYEGNMPCMLAHSHGVSLTTISGGETDLKPFPFHSMEYRLLLGRIGWQGRCIPPPQRSVLSLGPEFQN